MQIEFLTNKERAQIGQKVDATSAIVISATSNSDKHIPFGSLVVYDETDPFLCKLPSTKAHLEKPLGITLRQLHCQDYAPKNPMAVMRQGRVWVDAEKAEFVGDAVYVKFLDNGTAIFTSTKTGNTLLKGAIFLEKSDGGKTPIEVNFLGGA